MLRIVAFAAVIGAVVVALRDLGRLRTFGGKAGETSIARRRRCWSAACNSDLQRPGRRGKTDDHIRSVGYFGSVCYTHASLGSAKQPGGKIVHVWAIEEDWDPASLQSSTSEMEWPPRSGQRQSFPEIDRASWFGIAEARLKILKGQAVFLDQLLETLGRAEGSEQASANGRLLP